MTEAKRQALIERIARAMAASDGRVPDEPHGHPVEGSDFGPLTWHLYAIEAGHALAAHRALYGEAALSEL